MKVVATYNIKGGVGKTSAAINIAYLAAKDGCRTLLWDLDPQAAATYLLRVRPRVKGGGRRLIRGKSDLDAVIKASDYDGFDLLPSDFSYRNLDLALHDRKRPDRQLARLLRSLDADYDLVVLDCPPGISLVSENVFTAADLLLVPLIPTTLSMRTFDQLTDFVARLDGHRPAIGAFVSMADRRKRLHQEVMASLAARPDVLPVTIPAASAVERMGVTREPLVVSEPRGAAGVAYAELWAHCRRLLFAAAGTGIAD
jgi:cellulose biosynthesis protein BcsQ